MSGNVPVVDDDEGAGLERARVGQPPGGIEIAKNIQLIRIVKERRRIGVFNALLAFLLLLLAGTQSCLQLTLFRSSALGGKSPFTLFNGLPQFVFVSIRPLARQGASTEALLRSSGLVLVPVVRTRTAGHPISHMCAASSLLPQSRLILEQIRNIFGLLPDIGTLVLAVLVDVLELLERLDDVDVVPEIDDHVL